MQNLAGQPPLGNHPALCHQSSPTAGDAACEKNCVVYPASGKPFTLTASECTVPGAEPTTTLTFINPGTNTNLPTYTATDTAEPTTTITFINPGTNTHLPTHTATDTEPTTTITYIHSVPPPPSSSSSSGTQSGAATLTTALVNPGNNGTGGPGTGTGGPKPPVSTAGAVANQVANQVAGTLAVLGGIAAMLL